MHIQGFTTLKVGSHLILTGKRMFLSYWGDPFWRRLHNGKLNTKYIVRTCVLKAQKSNYSFTTNSFLGCDSSECRGILKPKYCFKRLLFRGGRIPSVCKPMSKMQQTFFALCKRHCCVNGFFVLNCLTLHALSTLTSLFLDLWTSSHPAFTVSVISAFLNAISLYNIS